MPTTIADTLLEELERRGITAEADGPDLRVESKDELPKPLAASIRRNKDALLDLLRDRDAAAEEQDGIPRRCACGRPVFFFQPGGTPLCQHHSSREAGGEGGLVAAATDAAPQIHLTLRATGNEEVDLRRLNTIYSLIKPHEGEFKNRVRVRLVEANMSTTVSWRADPAPGLRMGLARLLAAWVTKSAPAGVEQEWE